MCSELPRGAGVARRLRGYLSREGLPGLRSRLAKNRFLHELGLSSRKYRAMRIRRFRGSTDPSDSDFHPYSAICELARAGNAEEAIWLSFLTIVCGHVRGQENRWESVRCLYGGFGSTRWTWERVRAHPGSLREWMMKRRDDVRRLRFGNHRKYETHDPTKRGSTADIVDSYVKWVEKEGGGSQRWIFEETGRDQTPAAAFDALYRRIRVTRFGRTAKFDWLCLVGNLGLFPLAPGFCYLRGASGPVRGARRLFGSHAWRSVEVLEKKAVSLGRALGVPLEVMEDTLCNWQKTRRGTTSTPKSF